MYKARKIICTCLIFVLFMTVAIAYAAKDKDQKGDDVEFVVPDSSALDVTSCRYTQTEEERPVENRLADLSGFEVKMENDILAVYYSDEIRGIRILNKETGYVWGGLPQKKTEGLNEKWSSMANSIITIDYLGENCKSSRAALGADGNNLAFQWGTNEAVCNATFASAEISLSFTMRLEDDHFTVEILHDTIREGDNKLQSVWILPFFGTVKEDDTPGYIFVPDGSGALIRYNKKGAYTSVYDERIYGKDVSVDILSTAGDLVAKRNNDYLTETPQITIPVYGAVHGVNENAYMAVVEGGMEYASIYASPAGMITDYNWVCSRFDYRQAYSYPVNKSGKTIMTTQEKPEKFEARVTFYFLSDREANYSAMAVRYRELVKKSGVLMNTERRDENIPMYLHMVAGTVRDGILVNGYNKLTTIEEAGDIIEDLETYKITNLSVSYEGWQKRGTGGSKYGALKLDRRLGSKRDLESLNTTILENGGRFYLSVDPISFNEDQARTASTAALAISKKYSSYTRNNKNMMYPTEYYAHPSRVIHALQKAVGDYAGYNLDIANIGAMIYGDYSRNEKESRTECRELFTEALSGINAGKVLESPNQYMWNNTDEYINISLNNSQYLFETDSIPFLQIVLKGSLDYYAPFANQGFYNQVNRLKMIEYGAYPSFIVMSAENEKLIDTPLEDYFSLNYKDWSQVICNVYDFVNGALKEVEGSSITEHKMLSSGVASVTYDNGKTIYVNYLNKEYVTEQGIHIPAQNYFVADK